MLNGKAQPSTSQRIRLLEEQLFILSGFVTAMGQFMEVKNIATKDEIQTLAIRINEARSRGFTPEQYKKFADLATKLVIAQ